MYYNKWSYCYTEGPPAEILIYSKEWSATEFLFLSLFPTCPFVPFAPELLMVLFSLFHPSRPFINNESGEIKGIGEPEKVSLPGAKRRKERDSFRVGHSVHVRRSRWREIVKKEEKKKNNIYSRPKTFSKRSFKAKTTFVIHDRCHFFPSTILLSPHRYKRA